MDFGRYRFDGDLMPWALLLDLRVILGIAIVGMGIYAKVQTVRIAECKAEYAQFRADVESEAAKAKVAAAQEATRRALAAQEVLSDLQTRNAALNARYQRLRASAGSGIVPSVPAPAPSPSSVAGSPEVTDADARCLAVLESADREIGKFVELWNLQLLNSRPASP